MSTKEIVIPELSKPVREEIDRWLTKYPADQKRSAVLTALRLVQDEQDGWLTPEWMDAVANYLELPRIAVYEVATFYTMFNLKPVGRHEINVCTNISCMLSGSGDLVKQLEQKLGIKLGETTEDGKFTLKEAECLAACAGAPMFQIGKKYHEHLTSEKVDAILDELE